MHLPKTIFREAIIPPFDRYHTDSNIERTESRDSEYRHLAYRITSLQHYTTKYSSPPNGKICVNAQIWRCPCERVYSLSDRCRNSTIFVQCIMDSNKNILSRLFHLTPIDFKDENDEVIQILHCLQEFHIVKIVAGFSFVVPFTPQNAHRKRTCDNSFESK